MIPELTTPPGRAEALRAAGWTQVDATTWSHPDHLGPNCWIVALMLSDLPRVRHDMEHAEDDKLRGVRGRPKGYKQRKE